MKTPIILCFLLACAVCDQSGRSHDEANLEMEDNEALEMETKTNEKFPGKCYICRLLFKKAMKAISFRDSERTVETKVWNACSRLPIFIKGICKRLVRRYVGRIASELLAGHSARTACAVMRLCRWNESVRE